MGTLENVVRDVRWLSAEEQRTWRAYLRATRALHDVLDAQLQRDANMPHTYYEVLVALSEAPDRRLRMVQLAGQTGSSPSRLSHAVARLEERGWVERVSCPTDKRGQLAVLTEAGFTALAEAAPGHVEQVRAALLDPLTADQVRQLGQICTRVADALEGTPSGDADRLVGR
jgi:DNA-binding MarR family transcriptional regulator